MPKSNWKCGNSAYDTAYSTRNLVGSVPQLPDTLLGVVAGWVTGIVQRILFWYTPQIQQFHDATTTVLNRICALEERKFRTFLAVADRLERVEREARLLKASQHSARSTIAPDGSRPQVEIPEHAQSFPYTRSNIDARGFYSELQRRLQSCVRSDASRLEMYQSVLGNLDPSVPAGPWLDVGCGRGEWLRLVRDKGFEGVGVDSDPAAIQHCREASVKATEGDALEFLRTIDDKSLAVVSSFQVLEHCAFEYNLNLVYQIARTLKPGGALIIETPHPGNLLMATEQFWIDPTHQRPIPSSLMECLFEYCGLGVVHRFEVNPRPESEHLPFQELEPVHRLNYLLYGPQDYALLGRRAE